MRCKWGRCEYNGVQWGICVVSLTEALLWIDVVSPPVEVVSLESEPMYTLLVSNRVKAIVKRRRVNNLLIFVD